MSALLEAVERARKRRDRAHARTTAELENAIVSAYGEGRFHSLSEVGMAAGLSKQRVWQIVNARRR